MANQIEASPGYREPLEAAVHAARAAGAILRNELYRAGGPHGSGGHCPADAVAEREIRQRLHAAFPDFGVRGEECTADDRPSRDPDRHVWLIDPNDGTRAFIKGHRGAAVSIALLRNGTPVLGVVYAHTEPDGDGDLFAWAEGCGPLTRNGQLVQRQPWAERLTAGYTILVSQTGDQNSKANALLVAPARFRAVPSIAYRLALVAAGEGEVGVSLNGPQDWDYAAGHALLRGVGGELFDRSGRPVSYAPSGISHAGDCFGGSSALAPLLATADWSRVFERATANEAPYALVTPLKATHVADSGVLSRAQGCMLGQLAGDALGSLVEFRSAADIQREYPAGVRDLADGGAWNTIAGQPTDDSELALMLARSIIQAGQFKPEAAARAYAYWLTSGPFDVGSTTRRALGPAAEALRRGGAVAPAARESANSESQANGALMRVSPLGIYGAYREAQEVFQWASEDAALTHPHFVCRDASGIYAATVAHAIRSGEAPPQLFRFALDMARSQQVEAPVLAALQAAELNPPLEFSKNQGWVLVALQNAFYRLLHAQDPEAGIVETVMCGGDTDTNAAIAGALLGAAHGRGKIPSQWLSCVLTCRPIKELPNVRHPRPQCFWPVDALILAERLTILGDTALT